MPKKADDVLRGVAIGDLHFDKILNLIPNINKIIYKQCDSILRKAVERGYHVAVFLGDVFNYMNASEESTRLFLKLLVKYQDLIEIIVIEGNHGYKRNGTGSLSTLSMLEEFSLINVTFVIEPTCRVIKGVPLVFLPHPYTCLSDVRAKNYPAFMTMLSDSGMSEEEIEQADSLGADLEPCLSQSIGFGHFTRKGAIQDNGHSTKEGVDYNPDLDCAYYIVGHLHTPQTIGTTEYPGTFYQTSFGESEDKGYAEFIAKMEDYKVKFKYKRIKQDPPILLKNILITSKKRLPDLTKVSANVYYKVQAEKEIKIPQEYLDHPQFVFTNISNPSKSLSDNPTTSQSLFDSEDFCLSDTVKDYLESTALDDNQKKLALKMFKRAADDLGISIG